MGDLNVTLIRTFDISQNDAECRRLVAVGYWSLRLAGPLVTAIALASLWAGVSVKPMNSILILFFALLMTIASYLFWGATLTFEQPLSSVELTPTGFKLRSGKGVVRAIQWERMTRAISISYHNQSAADSYSSVPCVLSLHYRAYGLSALAADSIVQSARMAGCLVKDDPKPSTTYGRKLTIEAVRIEEPKGR